MTPIKRACQHLFPPAIGVVVLLFIWEAAVRLFQVPHYVLPGPLRIIEALDEPNLFLARDAAITAGEAAVGFLLGSAVGFVLGVALAESNLLRRVSLPLLVGSNAVPVVAIAPLILMWVGYGFLAKALVAAFLCFFPICVTTYRGLADADRRFRDLFRVMGATRFQYLLKARLPAAFPHVFSGAKLNATYAVIGAIVSEFIGATSGLGAGMIRAAYRSDAPRLWLYLAVAVMLGAFSYGTVGLYERWYNRHRRGGGTDDGETS